MPMESMEIVDVRTGMKSGVSDRRAPADQAVLDPFGFLVGTDDTFSHSPIYEGRSRVAVQLTDAEDLKRVRRRFKEAGIPGRFVRELGGVIRRLRPDDHLVIFGTKRSFRWDM